jgi:hypothetical protein
MLCGNLWSVHLHILNECITHCNQPTAALDFPHDRIPKIDECPMKTFDRTSLWQQLIFDSVHFATRKVSALIITV